MRPVYAYAAMFAALSLCPPALKAGESNATTLILQFEQAHSEKTLAEMRSELDQVMRNAGFSFDLRLFSELSPYAEFGNLMIIKLKGSCRMDLTAAPPSSRGPLAFTHTSDGKVLPFIEVACDRVRSTIRPVMWGEQFRRGDELMGRATARVIAHEIYHVLSGTRHGESGIARHALSGPQLIGDQLLFNPEDVERMISKSTPPHTH